MMRKEVQAKIAARAEQAAAKLLNKISLKMAELAKASAASVPLDMLFRQVHGAKYSAYDDAGRPTADAKGEPLSKAMAKEADKLQAKHAKEMEKHAAALSKNPTLVADLEAEVAARRAETRSILEADEANLPEEVAAQLRAAGAVALS